MYLDYTGYGAELQPHLDTDEKLLWTGAPRRGLILRATDVFMIPFSLLWGGFAFFWEFTVITSGAPFFFWIWGIPFVLIGLYMIIGRFFFDSEMRKNTVYGITRHRIIIMSGVFKKSVKSINIRTLSDITLEEKADGSGTIVLGPEMGTHGYFRGSGWSGTGNKTTPSLEFIPDVRQVYRQILELQKEK